MKKVMTLLCLFLFLTGAFYFSTNNFPITEPFAEQNLSQEDKNASFEEEEEEMPKESRMDKAMEHEFDMTHDPATQTIPRKRLLQARQLANQKRAQRGPIPGIEWVERGPINVGGRTRALLFDANDATGETVWAGSVGGGLWKTTSISAADPGWTPINDFFENIAISSIAQDTDNPDLMYFGTGEGWYNGDAIRGLGIWKSTDGGDNWNQLASTNNSTFNYVQKMAIDANGHLYACTRNGGVQKSEDEGATWTKILGSGTSASTNRAADMDIAADGTLFVSMGIQSGDGIYRSTDDGANWTKLTSGLPGSGHERIEFACAPSNANYVYALYQASSGNACLGIYRTQNGGDNWTEVDNPSALGMDNFARNQAWYDLIVEVDPNDEERVFIGGVDLLASSNGGNSWTQVSQWYGGGGYPYVHADQHEILFKPGSSSTILFGNDGGVFLTTNGTATEPDFEEKNLGYNVTQYYACAIHPTAEKNEYLAGSQDNGTQQYLSEGLNVTDRVTGGDGAFCHIDEDEPQIQISSYVYNVYYISDDGWNSGHSSVTIGDRDGRFINPTDYDSDANILYGSFNNGEYSIITNVGSTNTDGSREVDAFGSGKVSTVTVSPNVANRVYFGLDNGDVVVVDNANAATVTGTLIRNGSGYISSISIEEENENHLLVTYSNYGTNSVWESNDGGGAWTSVEGDLPDMPVRWGMFAPGNSNQALLATEVGVWSTDDLNGGQTEWAPSNAGLANTRVDMLQYRSSDNQIIAATHGRGLFSTNAFNEPVANLQVNNASHVENNVNNFLDNCRGYKDLLVPVKFTTAPPELISIIMNVDETTTASLGKDFVLMNDTMFFAPGLPLLQDMIVRVFDDAIAEATEEQIVLEMEASDYTGGATTYVLTINDNDLDPVTAQGVGSYDLGDGTSSFNSGPYGGYFEDVKTQILFLADELISAGVQPGALTALSFDVTNIQSTMPYSDLSVKLKMTDVNSLEGSVFEQGLTEVYSVSTFDPVLGWNKHEFNNPFVWDGVSNLIVETCFDNNAWTQDDAVHATQQNFTSVRWIRRDDIEGCDFLDQANSGTARPNIRFEQNTAVTIESALAESGSTYLQPDETAHIFSASGNVMASITQIGGSDIGCVDFEISRTGSEIQYPSWIEPYGISDKVIRVEADNDGTYEIAMYFSDATLNSWGAEKLNLNIIKTEGDFADANANNSVILPFGSIDVMTFSEANHIRYKGVFTGFSSFSLTNAPLIFLPVELLFFSGRHLGHSNELFWKTASETNNKGFEVQRSFDGQNFSTIGFVDGVGTSTEAQHYGFTDGDLQKDGEYYYRLRQIDYDGRSENSETIVLNVERSGQQFGLFPNPAKDRVQLTWQSEDAGTAQLYFYNAQGQQLSNLSTTVTANTIQWIDLQANGLAPGVYFVQWRNESSVLATRRLLVQ